MDVGQVGTGTGLLAKIAVLATVVGGTEHQFEEFGVVGIVSVILDRPEGLMSGSGPLCSIKYLEGDALIDEAEKNCLSYVLFCAQVSQTYKGFRIQTMTFTAPLCTLTLSASLGLQTKTIPNKFHPGIHFAFSQLARERWNSEPEGDG